MDRKEREALDRHITGHYGEDQDSEGTFITEVIDLRTGEAVAVYSLMPATAVMCAYAQLERKDFNTWEYESKYADKIRAGKHTVSCGDYAALLEGGTGLGITISL